jgi:hypothetical protein
MKNEKNQFSEPTNNYIMCKNILKTLFAFSLLINGIQVIAQSKPSDNKKSEIKKSVKAITLDLSSTGINATIQVPEGVAIIEDKYNILIGDGKEFLIQIEEAYSPFSEKVAFVKGNSVRGFVKFVKEETNGYIAEMNPFGSQKEYDFAIFIALNGSNYILQDPSTEHNRELNKIEEMYKVANTIKEK